MGIKNHAFCALFAVSALSVASANAGVDSLANGSNIRPVSQYGLIQNVQNYSSNPFWTTTSPYNQKMPQAVYAQGTELNTAECQGTVGTLVASYCSANNNCIGMDLSDIRPVIMLQLSRLPGHNYASSCSGFIDSEFDAFVEKHSTAVPSGVVSFPGATVANPDYDAPEFKLENPYIRKDGTWNGEEWQKEKKERSKELKNLQEQNGAGGEHLTRTAFPATVSDLSFNERMEIKQQGYEPYSNSSAYRSITPEKEEDYYNRRLQRANMDAYNATHPNGEQQTPIGPQYGVVGADGIMHLHLG